jgi:nardilysin
MFHRLDDVFRRPLAYYNFYVVSERPMADLREAICLDLLMNSVCLMMVEDTYPAELAHLSFSLYAGERGIVLKASGFNEKLPLVLSTMVQHIVSLDIPEEQFKAVREQTKRSYYNNFLKPMKLVREVRLEVIQHRYWPNTAKHAEVSSVSLSDVLDFKKRLLSNAFLQGLAQGNLTKEEALVCYKAVKNGLGLGPLSDGIVPELRCRELPTGRKILRVETLNKGDGNTAVTNYYQGQPGTLRSAATTELLAFLLEEPCFDQLRTKEQLGYTVFASFRNTHGILGISVTVCAQASKFDPGHVDGRILHFLRNFRDKKLPEMSDELFFSQLSTLIKQKKAADVTLHDEVSRNWAEVASGEYLFDRYLKDIEELESIEKANVVECLTALLNDKNQKSISVQVVGNPKAQKEEQPQDEDVDAVRRLQVLLPPRSSDAFVKDLTAFASDLTVYPVIHIVK